MTPTQAIYWRRKRHLAFKVRIRLLISLICTAAVALILFGVVFGIADISGNSMHPALASGDWILFSRIGGYGAGDIVILKVDGQQNTDEYIKRVVGVPGDTLDIDGAGHVLVNGSILTEPYAMGYTDQKSYIKYPLALQKDEYFVLGDNRENSLDSRNYGPIKGGDIIGKEKIIIRIGK